jgi:hypothetical protein
MNSYEYLAVAKRRFPNRVVGGSGRWAVDTPSWGNAKILLFETREAAQRSILDSRLCVIIDLDVPEKTLEEIPDRYSYEDRKWERQFKL